MGNTPLEKIPLLRAFIPFICGLFAAHYTGIQSFWLLITAIATLTILALSHFFLNKSESRKNFRWRWMPGVFINILFVLCGILLSRNSNNTEGPAHFSNYYTNGATVMLEVTEPPTPRAKSVKAVLEVIAVKKNYIWTKTEGRVVQYFEKTPESSALSYGDRIIHKAAFTEVAPPMNPGEFNYKKYLAGNGIYHQSWVRDGEWIKTGSGFGSPLMHFAGKARAFLLSQLALFKNNDIAYGLISALLLGISDNLDADTMKSFSSAGAIHVLCVSGLHVGIFYLMLGYLLGFLDKKRGGRILKMLLLLAAIWMYALITGLAPSVLRASTMFSVMIMARFINRHSCIYNTLIFSAMILITTDPGIISKPGFWLSYLAVLGIVYIYPRLYGLLTIKNKIGEKIWSLASVSIAAQMATTPLSLYYFGMFPNYFLVSNIIVVPLASLIVYLGTALLTLSFIPFAAGVLHTVLEWLLNGLYFTVYAVEMLPAAVSHISISIEQMVLLYAFLVLFLSFFELRRPIVLKAALVCLILTAGLHAAAGIRTRNNNKLIVYSIRNAWGMDIVKGDKALFIADSVLLNNQTLIDMHISGFRKKSGISTVYTISADAAGTTDTLWANTVYLRNSFLFVPGQKLFLTTPDAAYYPGNDRCNTNILLYRNGRSSQIEALLKTFSFSEAVTQKNINPRLRIDPLSIRRSSISALHNLSQQGAFILSLSPDF